jgi:hypothetical protein
MLEGSAGLTRADSVLGTPEYMSPEQALGRPADQRSDLYSLGIIIYQMLLGRTPFKAETPSATLLAHVHQPVPLPSKLDPGIGLRLQSVMLKSLAKEPDDRHQTLEELMEALRLASPASDAEFETQATLKAPPVSPLRPDDRVEKGDHKAQHTGAGTGQKSLSLDRSRVLAMSTARETPGGYGRGFSGVLMAFEVVAEEETEEHYVITLSLRPQGAFEGAPGREQFFIDKEGTVAHRQVLSLPVRVGGRHTRGIAIAAGLVAVAIAVTAGILMLNRDGGDVPAAGPGAGDLTATVSPPPAAGISPSPTPLVAPAATVASAAGAGEPVAPAILAPPPVTALKTAGTAVIWDDQGLSDAITYTLTGLPALAEGKVYVGWLASDDGALKLTTGPMSLGAEGSISHTFNHNSRGYAGLNLIHAFSKVVITLEEVGARFDAPLGPPLLSHEIPLGAMEHIRHLLTSWPSGADRGILTNLKGQLSVALFHARLASSSETIEEVRRQTEQLINVLDGPSGDTYGDLDGNGTVEDPGDGIGVFTHIDDLKHGRFADAEAPDDGVINEHAAAVADRGSTVEETTVNAMGRAKDALGALDIAAARVLLGPGEDTVINLLETALMVFAAQAYVEVQLMAAFTLEAVADAAATVAASGGHITYGMPGGRVYRVEALEGATPQDFSWVMDGSSSGSDLTLNISPDGQWLVLESERFDIDCAGWPCLGIVSWDQSAGEAVRAGGGEVVHPAQGQVAVASGGGAIVYQQEGVVDRHVTDLFVTTRGEGGWGAPLALTTESPYSWHLNPAISDDGARVLLQCGNESWDGHAICEVGTDGKGFRTVITPADGPGAGPDEGTLHNPDYAPDGSIVFAANWDGDAVWRLPAGGGGPAAVLAEHVEPCVLPDGRIAAVYIDWSKSETNPDIHIRVFDPVGGGVITVTVLAQVEGVTAGLGCGS